MKEKMRFVSAMTAVAMLVPAMAIPQGQMQILVVTGYGGSVPVTQVSGRNYVEVEALARLVNGSLSFGENQMTLTLPDTAAATPATPSPEASSAFSREFLRAGIEAMSTMREWHGALASAIGNPSSLTPVVLTPYQARAMTALRLAQTAAQTDADQSAAQLIVNEYQKMKQLNDKYLAKRAEVSYVAPDALQNDELDQSIIACGKSLAAMVASGQFLDDGTCH